MRLLRLYGNFIVANPWFAMYAIAAKTYIAYSIITDIQEMRREQGRQLAK